MIDTAPEFSDVIVYENKYKKLLPTTLPLSDKS